MKIFFEILNENPIATKWIIVATIAAKIISFKTCHTIKKDDNDGIVIKIAIIVPFTKISFEAFLLCFNYCSK